MKIEVGDVYDFEFDSNYSRSFEVLSVDDNTVRTKWSDMSQPVSHDRINIEEAIQNGSAKLRVEVKSLIDLYYENRKVL